jgi:hypothetical protein
VRDGKRALAFCVPLLQTVTEARRSREKMARHTAPLLPENSVWPNIFPWAT